MTADPIRLNRIQDRAADWQRKHTGHHHDPCRRSRDPPPRIGRHPGTRLYEPQATAAPRSDDRPRHQAARRAAVFRPAPTAGAGVRPCPGHRHRPRSSTRSPR